MRSPDELLSHATDELRDQLSTAPVPEFRPNRRVAPAVVAVALVVGMGFGAALTRWSGGDSNLETVVATQPEPSADDSQPVEPPVIADSGDTIDSGDTVVRGVFPEPVRLTDAAPGEFIAPLPGVSAFNADESLVLLYRTGSVPGEQVVLDTTTGEITADLNIDAPDIEHVYWNPLVADELVWLEDTRFIRQNVRTGARSELPTDCTTATTGRFTSPPSQSGRYPIACERDGSWTLVVVDVMVGTSAPSPVSIDGAGSDVEAMRISPSGELIAISYKGNPKTTVLDLDDGTESTRIETDGAVVIWATLPDGTEAVVLAGYGDVGPGTIVVVRPDGSTTVVVGPDAGDEYPPSGTALSATTAGGDSRIVATTRGPATGSSRLTGQVIVASIDPDSSDDPDSNNDLDGVVEVFGHDGGDVNGYWSSNTVSVSPSGKRLVWASDEGTDRTNTFIFDLPDILDLPD